MTLSKLGEFLSEWVLPILGGFTVMFSLAICTITRGEALRASSALAALIHPHVWR